MKKELILLFIMTLSLSFCNHAKADVRMPPGWGPVTITPPTPPQPPPNPPPPPPPPPPPCYPSGCYGCGWQSDGCGGSLYCGPCCSPVSGRCGSANGVKFLNTVTSYSGYSLCSSGSNSSSAFPAAGGSASWTCLGSCGGSSQSCSACRNKYPLRNQTSCPTNFTESKCPNLAACETKTINYSSLCLNYQYICYRPKTCTEINGTGYLTGTINELVGEPSNKYMVFKDMAIKVGDRDGNNRACYKKETCDKVINPNPPNGEVSKRNAAIHNCGTDDVFEPYQPAYTGLYNDGSILYCGDCRKTEAPWWQASVGNIYASGVIDSRISNKCTDSCNRHLITKSANTCESTEGGNPGIPISNSNSGTPVIVAGNYYTQRSNNKQATYAASSIVPTIKYSDFTNLLNDANIKNCGSDWLSGNSYLDTTNICRIKSTVVTAKQLDVKGKKKVVIFIEGDLKIDKPIKVEKDSFLAFIVKGSITIDPKIGIDPTLTNSCSTADMADVQGIYIAENIIFPNSPAVAGTYQTLVCDKKFIGAGSFIASEQIELKRTFKGCGANDTPYPNFNATHPTETFIYRPDLLLNMPEWMKQPKKMRLETI